MHCKKPTTMLTLVSVQTPGVGVQVVDFHGLKHGVVWSSPWRKCNCVSGSFYGAWCGLSRPMYSFYLNEMTRSSPALFEKIKNLTLVAENYDFDIFGLPNFVQ